ncbi:fumarylacetoacetate hydrolase family protein [Streptomyces sp. NPDC056061]|uniref:fumarylacetoacetate hydrolase family protein n=1 Tax=Streptomyces sp. NPDC056061 TaxID=3345700 RepID=UPI0035DEF53F
MTAALDGRPVQRANTSDLHFDVATPVARAGGLTPLEPGDLITTGTPGGTLSHPLAPAGTSASPSRVWVTSTASWRHRCPAPSSLECVERHGSQDHGRRARKTNSLPGRSGASRTSSTA